MNAKSGPNSTFSIAIHVDRSWQFTDFDDLTVLVTFATTGQ